MKNFVKPFYVDCNNDTFLKTILGSAIHRPYYICCISASVESFDLATDCLFLSVSLIPL